MRFAKYTSLFALPLLAVATPWANPTKTVTVTAVPTTTQPASQCYTGHIQCCNSVQSASDPAVTTLLGLLGIVLSDLDVLVGLTCTPISVIGAGGNSCSAQPVCCQNNNFNGLIAIGCTPINLGL
ncbi:fungal hydrophobin [Fomitiporia mediterranea MF3/22]|uniref:fungal hydrophobin n=1 Tax=Fomitiporia mediterranea (strain MF3/22) TaxID=694068 RepID=UPI000440975D|nr:fungal hydrophobin [Fomitiporia mediterranea MF3/22]EJC98269.1 fungal hydrophobin [Fomitiporia mediterranea MF3/22]